MQKKLQNFFMMTLGTVLMSAGIYFFKFPNNFSTGGVSGISIILGAVVPGISAGTFILIINIALLVIGFSFIGRDFGIKTVYCTLLMSLLIRGLEIMYPLTSPLTANPLLELVFAVFLPGLGSAMVFNVGASSGGTDILAMIIKRYFKVNISKALFFSDVVIVMLTSVVFGIEIWLFSVLGFLAKILALNNIIESFNTSKFLTIVTDKEEEIASFITIRLHKGATVSGGYTGAFSSDKKSVILTALNRGQAILLKNFVKVTDPHAFVVISNTSDIIGKGFRESF